MYTWPNVQVCSYNKAKPFLVAANDMTLSREFRVGVQKSFLQEDQALLDQVTLKTLRHLLAKRSLQDSTKQALTNLTQCWWQAPLGLEAGDKEPPSAFCHLKFLGFCDPAEVEMKNLNALEDHPVS